MRFVPFGMTKGSSLATFISFFTVVFVVLLVQDVFVVVTVVNGLSNNVQDDRTAATAAGTTSTAATTVETTTTTTTKYIIPEEDRYAEYPPPFANTVCPRRLSVSAGTKKNSMMTTTTGSTDSGSGSGSSVLQSNPIDKDSDFMKYHSDSTCDRVSYNQFKQSLSRHWKHQHYRALGTIDNIIPNEETIVCPMDVQRFSSSTTNSNTNTNMGGLDMTWIVENTASTPVVVSYLDPVTQMEVSAQNTKIFPAISDPNAILQPGKWMSIHTYEGHEFIVRSIVYDMNHGSGNSGSGGGGAMAAAGPVLLQYRAGLVPVGNTNSGMNVQCPEYDIEPIHPEKNTIVPEYSRTKAQPLRPCNTIDIGFRNVGNCPLHAYYVTSTSSTTTTNNDTTTTAPTTTRTPPTKQICSEQFKFHLGTQSSDLQDYMWDWTSTIKYEGTYIGHTFQFRLASNPNVIVDTVTVSPTYIRDCPTSKNIPLLSTTGSSIIDNTGTIIPTNALLSSTSSTSLLYQNLTTNNNNNKNNNISVGYSKNNTISTTTLLLNNNNNYNHKNKPYSDRLVHSF